MSFVIFLYADDMQWTNDDVPNETVPGAQVGFNPGGGHNGFSLPTSLTRYTLDIATSSNVGREGVWIFRVDNLQIELPGRPVTMYTHTHAHTHTHMHTHAHTHTNTHTHACYSGDYSVLPSELPSRLSSILFAFVHLE